MKTNRRDFLKLAGAAVGAFLARLGAVKAAAEEEPLEDWINFGSDSELEEMPLLDDITLNFDPAPIGDSPSEDIDILGILADCNAYDQRMRAKFLEAQAQSLDAEYAAMAEAEENEFQTNTNGLGDLYSQNGQLTFERIAKARKELEQRTEGCIQHMIFHSESGYAYETEDYGFTWKETDPDDYPV